MTQQQEIVRLDVVKSDAGIQVHRQGHARPDLQGTPVASLSEAVQYAGREFGLSSEVLLRYWPGSTPGHGPWYRLQLQAGPKGALRWQALLDLDAR